MASNTEEEDALDTAELAGEEEDEKRQSKPATTAAPSKFPSLRDLFKRGERSQFDVLSAELSDILEEEEEEEKQKQKQDIPPSSAAAGVDDSSSPIHRCRQSLVRPHHKNFWHRMTAPKPVMKHDQFFDYAEKCQVVLSGVGSERIEIPSLKECQSYLQNPEADAYRDKTTRLWRGRLMDTIMNILAAFYIYAASTFGFETILVLFNAAVATVVFCQEDVDHAVKLDFAFLAFAVVFPLTFLVQSTFNRREQALQRLADFKGAVESTALFTLTVDWPDNQGDSIGGRLALPDHFNANVVKDCRELVQLVYEYLSMPTVAHARNVVFWTKQRVTKKVHALQNDVVKRINDNMFDLMMHTEEMRKYGFPSGEASRLHQYHQYLQQRFEQLRMIKYYRTPQATRSFGRAYIIILPWLCGPYFAWVYEATSLPFALILSCFTFLIVLGLLNTQQGLEDPFLADYRSLMPGIDTVKLDFEMAVVLQALAQYYANAELRRSWERSELQRKKGKDWQMR